MADMVDRIISASRSRQNVWPDRIDKSTKKRFELHTYETLSEEDASNIRKLIKWIENSYNKKIELIGGGWGCTKFVFEIQATASEGAKIIRDIISNREFIEQAMEAKFKVFVIPSENERINISALRAKNMKTNTHINISDISNSQIQIESDNSTQVNKHNKQNSIEDIFSAWKKIVSNDDAISSDQKKDHIADIDTLHREISKANPRPSVVEAMLNSLGSIASLASFVHQIHPFLPVIA